MKKLFTILANFVLVGFSSIFSAENHQGVVPEDNQIYFVNQNGYFVADDTNDSNFAISFYNLIGYNTEQEAREEKNGRLIGIQCYLSYRASTLGQNKWVYILNKESNHRTFFVRQQESFYSSKLIGGKLICIPQPVEIVKLADRYYGMAQK